MLTSKLARVVARLRLFRNVSELDARLARTENSYNDLLGKIISLEGGIENAEQKASEELREKVDNLERDVGRSIQIVTQAAARSEAMLDVAKKMVDRAQEMPSQEAIASDREW